MQYQLLEHFCADEDGCGKILSAGTAVSLNEMLSLAVTKCWQSCMRLYHKTMHTCAIFRYHGLLRSSCHALP